MMNSEGYNALPCIAGTSVLGFTVLCSLLAFVSYLIWNYKRHRQGRD